MILLEDISFLHDASIRDYGGAPGIRDIGLLKSAIARPFQTFDGKALYATPIEKAAALSESLVINHPFLDGNKRSALLGMLTVLMEYKLVVKVGDSELYNLIIHLSTGEIKFEEMVAWLHKNAVVFNIKFLYPY